MRPHKIALLCMSLLLLPACGGAEGSSASEPAASPAAPKADASGTFACRDYRKIVGDLDVLTSSELRERVKKVHDNARLSETDGIPDAARQMLAAATADDGEAFMQAAGQMSESCAAFGV